MTRRIVKKAKLTVRIDTWMKKALEDMVGDADEIGFPLSVSKLVRLALDNFLEEWEDGRKLYKLCHKIKDSSLVSNKEYIIQIRRVKKYGE